MFKHSSGQQRRTSDPSSPAPIVERLEDRALLAGNVIGVVAGGTLTLTGDTDDNTFVVDQPFPLSAQQFQVTGTGGTLINGLPSMIFNVVKKDVKINLFAGDDEVTFDAVALPGNLQINGGDGDNSVTLDNASTVAKRVTVHNGEGDDTFELLAGSRIDHNVLLVNGNGDSSTLLDNSIVLWDLTVRARDGGDSLIIQNVSLVNRFVRANFGTGGSTTVVDDSGITGRLFVNAGPGGVDAVDILNGSILSRGASLRTGGLLSFIADDSRFDDNVDARGNGGLAASLTGESYFAFRLALTGGSTFPSTVDLDTVTVNGLFSIRTDGGDDTVTINDSTFNRRATIRLGGGDDSLLVEQLGVVPGVTTFNGPFSFSGGAGDDTVSLGVPAIPGSQVVFNGTAFFNGGAGVNVHTLPENALYAVTPVFKNF
ncbi:MAG: hypothetical protein PHU85_01010 [Phycisphaerae bacterium]|nr:hypothetical protein [Phycisphaerae bacterium]